MFSILNFKTEFSLTKVHTRVGERGVSLIEVLLVMAILAVLLLIAIQFITPQVNRSYDSRRKADLEKVKVAFENYYADNQCYPALNVLDSCGSDSLAPYLDQVPCDPQTKQPYVYAPYPSAQDRCKGFRIYATLNDPNDPSITDLKCNGSNGCGVPLWAVRSSVPAARYNYGTSVGVAVGDPSATPAPTSTPAPGPSFPPGATTGVTCSTGNICNVCQLVSNLPGEQCPPPESGNLFVDLNSCLASGCALNAPN